MAQRVDSVILDSLTADPGAPADGELWHNSTDNKLRARENGVTKDLSDTGGAAELIERVGVVAAGTFGGNPKTALVTFSGAGYSDMPDNNYGVFISSLSGGSNFSPVITTKDATGFTINMSTNNLGSLVEVHWFAKQHGESG